MVILPHGGPHVRDSADYDDLAQFISTCGYIVIQPNFRGSSDYGKDFEESGYKQWGGVMQDDLTDAVDFMVKEGYAIPGKICIVGASYGGYAALMGAIKTPSLYQCSIGINAVTHLKDLIKFDTDLAKSEKDTIRDLHYKRIGNIKNDSDLLDNNSPALHVDRIKIPILIIAGTEDKTVPIEQSEMMVEVLERHNKDHKYVEIKDANHHIFNHKEDTEKVYSEIEIFLRENLEK